MLLVLILDLICGLRINTHYQNRIYAKRFYKKTQEFFRSQDTNGNGEIDNNEIDPSIGKLIPRGRKKLGELIGDWK
jgi:hypothetical protein